MTTDLKPGDLVQHPEHGYGVVLKNFPGVPTIYFADKHGYEDTTRRFTGWERVETCTRSERQWLDYRGGVRCTCDHNPATTNGPEEDCEIHGRPYAEWVKRAAGAQAESARIETVRPGHVHLHVDDLDLGPDTGDSEEDFVAGWQSDFPEYSKADLRLIYRAIAAQRAESTPTADEKPTSTTVTLYCPDCGEAVHVTVVMLGRQGSGERWLGLRDSYVHTCPPRHADEPTEAGILLEIKYLRYVSIVLKGRVGYVSVDQGGIFEWSYLVNLANEMNESIKLGWGQE